MKNLQARRSSPSSPGYMFEASALEETRCMSVTYSNFTHNIFASGHRRVRGFGGEPKGKGHFGKSRCRREDLKMDLEKWEGGIDWIGVAQRRYR